MPAEIVNLNKFRKAKERAEKERQAEQNRAKFGRTKEARLSGDDEQERRDKLLDGLKLSSPPCEPDGRGNEQSESGDLDPGTVS